VADRAQIRRRLLLRLFGHPLTVGLSLLGTTSVLTPLFFPVDAPIPLFVGITSLAGAGAWVLLRALYGADAITTSIQQDIEAEETTSAAAVLDALDAELSADDDPRDEELLRDLRRLLVAIQEQGQWREHVNRAAAEDLQLGLNKLFEGSVAALRRSAELARMSREVRSDKARESLAAEREVLLADVRASVEHVARLVGELEILATRSDDTGPDLSRIRTEIAASLEAAHVAVAQVESFGDTTSDARRRMLAAKKHQEKQ